MDRDEAIIMKDDFPYFPLYVSDFLSDPDTMLLNSQQIGKYFLLLMYQWKKGSIPGKICEISVICREQNQEVMQQDWDLISRCFKRVKDPIENEYFLINSRLEIERKKIKKSIKQKIAAGKKGGKTRWGADNKGYSTAIAPPLAPPLAPLKHLDPDLDLEIYKKNFFKKSSEKTKIAQEWQPSTEIASTIVGKYQWLEIQKERDKFVSFHQAKGSKNENWDAAFEYWCQTAASKHEVKTKVSTDKKQRWEILKEAITVKDRWTNEIYNLSDWEYSPYGNYFRKGSQIANVANLVIVEGA